MRELESLRAGIELGALAIGDVAHDAENLVAIATDDGGLEEVLGVVEGVAEMAMA